MDMGKIGIVLSKMIYITAPNRSKSYPNDMNKNCLEELPDMTRRT
jgi:hypothetical protein